RIYDSGPIIVRADAEPPLGSLESPTDGTTIRDIVTVSGWVLDQFDTKPVVGFLVDGQTVVSTLNRTSRPDVCQVYSTIANCAASNPGISFKWNSTTVANGPHSLQFKITNSAGLFTTLGPSVTVDNRV